MVGGVSGDTTLVVGTPGSNKDSLVGVVPVGGQVGPRSVGPAAAGGIRRVQAQGLHEAVDGEGVAADGEEVFHIGPGGVALLDGGGRGW